MWGVFMEKIDIIASLSSDELKIEYLNSIDKFEERLKIIKSLSKALYDEYLLSLITELKSLPKFETFLNEVNTNIDSNLAKSLSANDLNFSIILFGMTEGSDEFIKKAYRYHEYMYIFNQIFDSLFADEIRTQLLKEIKFEPWKIKLIKMLKSDASKMECLREIHDVENILLIAKSLDDIKMKKEVFEKYISEDFKNNHESKYDTDFKDLRTDIILFDTEQKLKELDDAGAKYEIFKNIDTGWLKYRCTSTSINRDDFKITILDNYLNKDFLLKSLNSDEFKLKLLNLIEEPHIKKSVILSLKSDEEKLKFINMFELNDKIKLLSTIASDKIKIDYMKELYENGELKYITLFLSNYPLLSKLIKSIKTDEAKMVIINFLDYGHKHLESDELKIQLIGKPTEKINFKVDLENLLRKCELSDQELQLRKHDAKAWLRGK